MVCEELWGMPAPFCAGVWPEPCAPSRASTWCGRPRCPPGVGALGRRSEEGPRCAGLAQIWGAGPWLDHVPLELRATEGLGLEYA